MNAAPFALSQSAPSIPQLSVNQGEVHFTAEPKILTTVLGSCVAVCLWDQIRGAGGMNHFVLPFDPQRENSTRYGDVAIDKLVHGLLRLGCNIADMQAKIFGGAAVLPSASGETVGSVNVRLARNRLSFYQIPVAGQRTGGSLGHQIRFYTRTGEVLFRQLAGGTSQGVATLALDAPGRRS